jgi:hypothetical protein
MRRPIRIRFALEMRQLLGSGRRLVDIWNGITVLVAPYARRSGDGMLLTALNYAAQPLPIQVRVRGTFSAVQYEAPGKQTVLLPFEHRDGGTEFVLPALRIGAPASFSRLCLDSAARVSQCRRVYTTDNPSVLGGFMRTTRPLLSSALIALAVTLLVPGSSGRRPAPLR